jgi:hypothetical protein
VPRKSRKQLVGEVEDNERREREKEYNHLEGVLHREWEQRSASGDVAPDQPNRGTSVESAGDSPE